MNGRLKIHLKANERLFINGGALRVDRKVGIELLNDVVFLLESHVMTAEQATTPLRRLYLAVQTMMLEPRPAARSQRDFASIHADLLGATEDSRMRDEFAEIKHLVESDKSYEALKRIKALIVCEPAGWRHDI